MDETVTITRAEYDRLCAAEEDFQDHRAAFAAANALRPARRNSCPLPSPTVSSTARAP
ncbi:MAG: hypothetical protein OXL38_07515 [Gammaproteobacteria bacterium]|nr:hypothetical protein [Gammaproteobacteria bacterium]